jgi:THO complex subunit 2
MAPGKRKRTDRGSVDSGDNRPSPHRPGNTALGQHERDSEMRNGERGGRGRGRGGRGGNRGRGFDRRDSSDSLNHAAAPPRTPSAMSAPPTRPDPPKQTPSQSTPSAQSPAPVEATPAPRPRKEPSPYDYCHITDARVSSWSTEGRQAVVAAGVQAIDDQDTLDLSSTFQELIRAALDRRLDARDAGECARDILSAAAAQSSDTVDGSALFLDSVSIIADVEEYDPALRELLVATGISPELMRLTLDAPLLQNLGLTRNTFIKAGIRQVTNLLYRQANHNLLREETEGYAKLMTELYTTSGSEPPTSEVVENAFERVKGLIGTFDLDVGRVLDVTMDVFAAVLVKQFRFFVKFLRISSWWPRELNLHGITVAGSIDRGLPKWALPGYGGWTTLPEDEEATARYQKERVKVFWERVREIGFDAFYELGGRRAVGKDTKTIEVGENGDTEAAVDGDLQWIQATGTLPPTGNRTAAQLLGFKLRFYASEARSPKEDLPPNLIYLAALLIKIGFISLRDLYPHLWPLDEDMAAVREKRMKELAEKEKQSRPGATMNALMTAGALADDTLPSSGRVRETAPSKADVSSGTATAAEETPKDKHNEPFDQKVQLLTNLLTVGAIPEALFILGRFPWLPEAFPELYNLIHRILHHSVSKVFEESRPEPSPEEELVPRKMPDDEQASAPKGYVRLTDGTKTIVRRWPYPDRGPEGVEQIAYKFYWDEWADNVPVCQNVDDIFTLCSTFLNLSGVNIGRDAALLRKMYDIGRKSLAEDQSEANLARWQDLLKRVLVPALSFTEANGSLPNQLFDLLRYYPTHVRFSLYAEWYEGQTSRIPAIMTAFTRTRLQTLSTMKRISKTNVTEMARSLAKTAYASPGVVFKVALDQIEAYSNLTEVVVECAKYFTDLGYDVLIWSLLSSLGGQSRSRTRADSVLLTSRWLLALSKFSGKVFRRYSNMDATPILQYVADQLHRGNSTDLIILEELIGQMSGVVSDLDFNDAQLLAMTGGEALRRQTLINLQDKRYESEKTASRLMRALTATRLAGELLVSIAQHRQQAIYAVPEEDAHIKYLSAMIDESQRILVQYLDLLRSNLSVEQFDALVPGIPELMAEYGLETPLAFLLGRGSYARRLDDHVELKTVTNGTKVAVDEDGDTSMKTEEPAPLEASQKSPDDDVEMGGQAAEAAPATPYPPTTDGWQQALEPLVNAVQSVLPAKTWQLVHPQLYVVFWQHSLPDLAMPMESYSAEIRRLSNQISDLIKDRSSTGAARREESRKALEATKDELMKETSERMAKFTNIRARLNHEKKQWFINNNKYDMVNDALLEELFLPRLLLSPTDADYCFKFIKFLHNNGTPNFRTLSLYARLFRANRLRTIIFTCTIREAENLGRFLKHILGDLSKWHAKQDVYEKEALGGSDRKLPGFAKQMGKDEKPVSLVEHDDFRRIVFSFHKQLNTALKSCLSGTEWMHIRNAITVLKSIVEYFPALEFQGKSYLSTLKLIGQREAKTREDLALTANALIPELKRRESKWVMPQAFATNLVSTVEQCW